MKQKRITYIKNILVPCFAFSLITGVVTGILIFLFKAASGYVIEASGKIYGYVRGNPVWLPCLIVGAAAVGLLSAFILARTKNCRGGGIPTSVAIVRGLIDFRWFNSIFFLFGTACLTFLGGVPLGNEGPSVQMGTAVGRGTIRLFGKKHKALDRYIMTGGACGGFAVATGAPLTGILFAFEEAHRRFSPMIFMTAAMTVTASTTVMRILCSFTNVSPYLFDFDISTSLPLRFIWIAAVVGIVCGFSAVLFTKIYAVIGNFLRGTLGNLPFIVKIVAIFALASLFGVASDGFIGTGHGIIDELIEGHGIWYSMIMYLCVRALFLMLANNAGVSGGIFVPTLAFGALLGALISKAAVALGVLPEEYFVVPVIIGMASFLAAASRTPLSAISFSLEALCGIANILPITLGVTLAFTVIETVGITSLHDTVIVQKLEAFNKGKSATVVDGFVEVMQGSFAVGKEPRDILWPPTCMVLSVRKPYTAHTTHEVGIMGEGDIIHIHYQTFDEKTTFDAIEAIVGLQADSDDMRAHRVNEKKHIVPEI